MTLFTFSPPPGLFNDGTSYSIKGVWFTGDKVRFRGGFPEKIGGWSRLTSSVFNGICRSLIQWTDLSGVRHIGVGTNTKYYVESSGALLADKTPLRESPLGNDPFSFTNTSTTATVTHRAHGQAIGDRVIFSGAETGGGLTAVQLNTTYVIATVPTADTYTITLPAAATSTEAGGGPIVRALYSTEFTSPLLASPLATTNTSAVVAVTHVNHGCAAGDFVLFDGASAVGGITIDGEYTVTSVTSADVYTITHSAPATSTTTGGGSVATVQYYLSVGLADYTNSIGWGSGGWGVGTWGVGGASIGFGSQLRIWSVATFGEDLILNPRGGAVYFYDQSVGGRAYDIRLIADAAEPPTAANFILVSPEDRRVLAFGCTDPNTGVFDPLLIRWCDNEDLGNWDPSDTAATAGFLRLSAGSEIVCAAKSRQEILVWTEGTLSAMRFVEDLIYSISMISPNIDILGPNTVMAVDDSVYWMGRENFFIYNGRVQVMPCAVRQYVFGDINLDQSYKVTASSNRLFREIRWDYPSSDSYENDRYVVFNYAENVWYFGTMDRTAWSDAGITNYPIAASPDGYIYYHEFGWDDGSSDPTTAIEAYVESSPIEMDEGERFTFVTRIIPDITFGESTTSTPSVEYTITPSNWPGGSLNTADNGTTTRSATLPVEGWTEKMDVRMRGRQFLLKVLSGTKTGVKWRLGKQRFDVRPDGRR